MGERGRENAIEGGERARVGERRRERAGEGSGQEQASPPDEE